jgi:hypothetical protein
LSHYPPVNRNLLEEDEAMQETVEEMRSTIEAAARQLLAITEPGSETRPAPDKWSKKEVLGHLIDSAANNHQRFVRAQLSDELSFPGYEQEGWVATQRYQGESWEQLVRLWQSYNLHLLHLMRGVPAGKLQNRCRIGQGEPVTLEFLMTDYLRHLKHHLGQIFD